MKVAFLGQPTLLLMKIGFCDWPQPIHGAMERDNMLHEK